MKRISWLCLCVFLLTLAGCHSQSTPRFELSEDTSSLIRSAQKAVQSELESGFGTPAEMVVWPALNVDFGAYSGTVTKVTSREGILVVDLQPVEGSTLADSSRASLLSGAALSVPGEGLFRVASYDPEQKTLSVVNEAGEPATPAVKESDSITVLGDGLQRGRDLYLRHCVHCHGSSGDGNGPTAPYLTPRPRDYRKGIFKFTSTGAKTRASRDDLFRIVKLGVPATYMPSFMLLPDDEVRAIVEYVRWLAMRGEMEGKLTANIRLDFSRDGAKDRPSDEVEAEFTEFVQGDLPDLVAGIQEELTEDWSAPEREDQVLLPKEPRVEPSAESIARGRAIFMGEKAKCYSCHGETARGNGVATEEINDLPGTQIKADKPGLFDAWGNIVKPRDLTRGVYRGGRRPIDIYRRVAAGIKGTPMQAFGGNLSDQDIWDVVNYVMSLPFESKN